MSLARVSAALRCMFFFFFFSFCLRRLFDAIACIVWRARESLGLWKWHTHHIPPPPFFFLSFFLGEWVSEGDCMDGWMERDIDTPLCFCFPLSTFHFPLSQASEF